MKASLAFMASALATALTPPLSCAPDLGFNYTSHLLPVGSNHTYHYLESIPPLSAPYKGTIVLVHGFPDLSYGWHNQIPFLSNLGYRVIAPDMLGYARTSAPVEVEPYHRRNIASDLVELIGKVAPEEQVILGGHDWGATTVWTAVVYYPEMFRAVIGMAVPFGPPAPEYVDLKDVIDNGNLLNLGYQLQLREPDFAEKIRGPDMIRNFIRGVFNGTTADGHPVVNEIHGVDFSLLPHVEPSPFLTPALEDIYVSELTRTQSTLRGPLNYYRTMKADWEDETAFVESGGEFRIEQPTLFVCGKKDIFVPCTMSQGMEENFANVEMHEMDTTHWIQLEQPDAFNALMEQWLAGLEVKDTNLSRK